MTCLGALLAAAESEATAARYAALTDEAKAASVFGAPFYVVDSGQNFWGQDSLEDLDLHLQGKL